MDSDMLQLRSYAYKVQLFGPLPLASSLDSLLHPAIPSLPLTGPESDLDFWDKRAFRDEIKWQSNLWEWTKWEVTQAQLGQLKRFRARLGGLNSNNDEDDGLMRRSADSVEPIFMVSEMTLKDEYLLPRKARYRPPSKKKLLQPKLEPEGWPQDDDEMVAMEDMPAIEDALHLRLEATSSAMACLKSHLQHIKRPPPLLPLETLAPPPSPPRAPSPVLFARPPDKAPIPALSWPTVPVTSSPIVSMTQWNALEHIQPIPSSSPSPSTFTSKATANRNRTPTIFSSSPEPYRSPGFRVPEPPIFPRVVALDPKQPTTDICTANLLTLDPSRRLLSSPSPSVSSTTLILAFPLPESSPAPAPASPPSSSNPRATFNPLRLPIPPLSPDPLTSSEPFTSPLVDIELGTVSGLRALTLELPWSAWSLTREEEEGWREVGERDEEVGGVDVGVEGIGLEGEGELSWQEGGLEEFETEPEEEAEVYILRARKEVEEERKAVNDDVDELGNKAENDGGKRDERQVDAASNPEVVMARDSDIDAFTASEEVEPNLDGTVDAADVVDHGGAFEGDIEGEEGVNGDAIEVDIYPRFEVFVDPENASPVSAAVLEDALRLPSYEHSPLVPSPDLNDVEELAPAAITPQQEEQEEEVPFIFPSVWGSDSSRGSTQSDLDVTSAALWHGETTLPTSGTDSVSTFNTFATDYRGENGPAGGNESLVGEPRLELNVEGSCAAPATISHGSAEAQGSLSSTPAVRTRQAPFRSEQKKRKSGGSSVLESFLLRRGLRPTSSALPPVSTPTTTSTAVNPNSSTIAHIPITTPALESPIATPSFLLDSADDTTVAELSPYRVIASLDLLQNQPLYRALSATMILVDAPPSPFPSNRFTTIEPHLILNSTTCVLFRPLGKLVGNVVRLEELDPTHHPTREEAMLTTLTRFAHSFDRVLVVLEDLASAMGRSPFTPPVCTALTSLEVAVKEYLPGLMVEVVVSSGAEQSAMMVGKLLRYLAVAASKATI